MVQHPASSDDGPSAGRGAAGSRGASRTDTSWARCARVLLGMTLVVSVTFLVHAQDMVWKSVEPNHGRKMLAKAELPDLRKGEKYGEPCNLKVCEPHGKNAARLYVLETFDGVGHRIANMLNGMAVSNSLGMNFGGIIRQPGTRHDTDHGIHFGEVLDGMFGPGAAEQLLFRTHRFYTKEADYYDMKLHRPFDLESKDKDLATKIKGVKPRATVYTATVSIHTDQSLKGYFPEPYQNLLAEGLKSRPLEFAPGKRSVAIHVRRGDLPKGDARALHEEYYFDLVKVIRELNPDADVHVYSSVVGKVRHDETHWSDDDFEDFRSHGMKVHLDDDDILDPWAHMVQADVFVTSLSYFSYTPGLLSNNCVVYPGYVAHPGHRAEVPDNWINSLEIEGLHAKPHKVPRRRDHDFPGDFDELRRLADDPTAVFKEKLRQCLERVDAKK